MQFPKSYFEDEVREGFYIPGMMKRLWAAQLEVLEDIARVCEKYKIRWFADCGTLLGAVRHGGYIPWDDDLDICMLRDDYTKFQSIVEKELKGNYFVLKHDISENCCMMHMRVTNGKVYCTEEAHLKKFHDCPYAVGIDIFPLDYVAPTPEEEQARKEIAKIVFDLTISLGVNDKDRENAEIEAMLHSVEEMCNVVFDRNMSLREQLIRLTEQLFSMYDSKEAKEVVWMSYWLEKDDHKYPIEFFKETIELPFEGSKILAPAAYDGILRIEYGDFMKIVRTGGEHEYPVYRKQERYLKENHNIIVEPKYEFSKEDLVREEVPERKNLKTTALEYLGLFGSVHEEICNHLIQGQLNEALELLRVAQEGAIQLGNLIDEQQGEGCNTVRCLEEYCEVLFCIFEGLTTDTDITLDDIIMAFQEIAEKIEKSIQEDIKIKKEIVFLPYKASVWESMESIWKSACEDPDCDVYVIPVPHYRRSVDGAIGDLYWDAEEYPDYVPITHYEQYNFENRLPDMIYINSPYDEFNISVGTPSAFYSKKLKKYTKQLIYIPYFLLEEIKADDERAIQSLDYFVTMPGVVHADKVIVQSENIRQHYIERLVEFAGEDTRTVWEEKILGLGSPLMDKKSISEIKKQKMPEKWKKLLQKPDGSDKKVILYYNSLSAFQQYGEKMLKKIVEVFATFKEHQEDVIMLWRPDPLIAIVVKNTQPEIWKEYRKIRKQFWAEGWGIYDDSADVEMAVAVCDGYYGDTGSVAQMCRVWEKPVMIQMV